MILTCERCSRKFKSRKRTARFCGHSCHGAAKRLLDVTALKRLAFSGETVTEIARELGVARASAQKALRRFGLYEMWREQRYA